MANRNWASGGKIYSMHVSPVLLDCSFIVDSTNANGIRSLKGPAISAVYMNTSATPSVGNPNPAAGVILLQLADNYNRVYLIPSSIVSPLSGSDLTSVTASTTYVITALGTATAAQWAAKGLPSGFTAAVGQSFVATASGTIGGSATVQITATAGSNITNIESIGDRQTMLSNSNAGSGAQLLMQCFKNGAKAAPADGTLISLAVYLSNSSVIIQGE